MFENNMAAHLPDVIDEDILCCRLCLRQTHKPKLLPCLHVFCANCLEVYVQKHASDHDATAVHSESADYLTFPDTPQDGKHVWGSHLMPAKLANGVNRTSSGSGSEDGQKRKLERYTNRDSLVQSIHQYREKYKKKRSGSTSSNHSNAFRSPVSSTSSEKFNSNGNESPRDREDLKTKTCDMSQHQSCSRSPKKNKSFTRAISSPTRLFQTADDDEEEAMNQQGRVSNIVNLYEKRSFSNPKRNPPLALFRPRSKEKSCPPEFVPLSERSLPSPYTGNKFPPRSRSFDASAFYPSPDKSIIPQSCSLSTQDSYDSAIGSPEDDKQLIFVDGGRDTVQNRISSISEENPYEAYEIPEDLRRHKTSEESEYVLRQSLLRQSGIYELPEAPGHSNPQALPSDRSQEQSSKTSSKPRKKIKRLYIPPPNPLDNVVNFPTPAAERPVSMLSEHGEHLYHEIAVMRDPRVNTMISPSRSVPDLLADTPERDVDSANTTNKQRPKLRRNSTILDSYVMVSDLINHDKDKTNDLNFRIPLSHEDSQRISTMYMRMDGTATGQRNRRNRASRTSYISIDGLSPTVESVATLVRSISKDFESIQNSNQAQNQRDLAKSEEQLPNEPAQALKDSPIYANSDFDQSTVNMKPELDQTVPIYDTPQNEFEKYTANNDNIDSNLKRPIRNTNSPRHTRNDRQVPCPTCQRLFVLPPDGVTGLQDCAFASQMQEVVLTQKCETKQCDHCENKSAQSKCLHCQIYLCTGCRRGHQWSKLNKHHKVMTLQELQSGKFQQEIKELQVTKCDVDKKNTAKHYCTQCDQVMCSDCLVNHSRNHSSGSIEQVAAREQDFIGASVDVLQGRKETFQGAADNLTNYQNYCLTSRDDILDQIQVHQDFVHLLLDRSFELLRSKVIQEFDAETTRTDELKRTVHQNISSMDYAAKFVDQLMLHGNPGSIVSMATKVKQEVARLQSIQPKVMERQMQMQFHPKKVSLKEMQLLCGEVKSETTPLQQVNAEYGVDDTDLVQHNTHQMVLIKEFTTKLRGDKKGCRPNGVSMMGDIIVVVDDINKKVKGFQSDGSLQWEICPQHHNALLDPWDVAVLHNGHIAVTDKGTNDVKIFKTNGTLVRSFGTHFKKPWGIATNSNGEIIVTDTELRKVFIHDSAGLLLRTLPHSFTDPNISPNATNFSLKCPEYVCCNKYDDIIISDFENHRILSFDALGRPLFKFGKKGKGMEEFYYPLGVSTDQSGNIYVVNYKNQRITVVTRNGQFHCCLTTKHGLHSLQTLTIDNKGHLVVVDGDKVKIYKLPPRIVGTGYHQIPPTPKTKGVFVLEPIDDRQNETQKPAGKETAV